MKLFTFTLSHSILAEDEGQAKEKFQDHLDNSQEQDIATNLDCDLEKNPEVDSDIEDLEDLEDLEDRLDRFFDDLVSNITENEKKQDS